MTVRDACVKGTKLLERQGIPEAALDAWYLLEHITGISRARYLSDGGQALEEALEARYFALIEKRGRRIPLQHLTGVQEFMGYSFLVSRHVLIPRQDTETLTELVLQEQKDRKKKVLDLCTGSGCIAISLGVLGGYEDVTAVDLSAEALKVARENGERLLGRDRTIRFLQGDLFDCVEGRFDIITANPPYIATQVIRGLAPEVRDYEPRMALDGDEDGLSFYRRIAAQARGRLNPGGCVYLEIGHDQGRAVRDLLEAAGFENIRIVKDTPGLDRVVYAEGGRNV